MFLLYKINDGKGETMKLVLAEPKLLRESVTIISDLVNEATFKIDSNGMEMVAMDPANVAMVIFKLLSSSFADTQEGRAFRHALSRTGREEQ